MDNVGLRMWGAQCRQLQSMHRKTGCGREECKAQSVGNTHSDDANGESVSEIFMRVQLKSCSHRDANTHTLKALTSH